MPTPALTTSKPVTTITHEVKISHRTPDYLDLLTILLPVVIPFFTFLLGYYMNSWYEKLKERKRLENVKNYFLTLAEFLVKITSAQAKLIEDSKEQIHTVKNSGTEINMYSELNVSRIKAIPDIDLYNIFVRNKNKVGDSAIVLTSLSSNLDAIDEVKLRLSKLNNEFTKEILLFIKKFNKNIIFLSDENSKLVMRNKSFTEIRGVEAIPLHFILTKIGNDFKEKIVSEGIVASDIRSRYNYFIKPLYEGILNIEETSSTIDLLNAIHKMNHDYYNFLTVRDRAVEIIDDLIFNLNNISAELNNICYSLKK